MIYIDKTLVCLDCGCEFEFTAEHQRTLAQRGFTREPRRCDACDERLAKSRKAARRTQRPPAGPPQRRALFPAVCAECGQPAQVPFQPRKGRPVYCRQCFAAHSSGVAGRNEPRRS